MQKFRGAEPVADTRKISSGYIGSCRRVSFQHVSWRSLAIEVEASDVRKQWANTLHSLPDVREFVLQLRAETCLRSNRLEGSIRRVVAVPLTWCARPASGRGGSERMWQEDSSGQCSIAPMWLLCFQILDLWLRHFAGGKARS